MLCLCLSIANHIEAKVTAEFTIKLDALALENAVLRSQADIVRSLRVDLMRHKDFTLLQHKDNSTRIHSRTSIAYYSTIRARLEAALHDLWDFAEPILQPGMAPEHRHFVYEWYRLMCAYVESLATRDYADRQVEQEQLGTLIREKLDALQMPANSSECDNRKLVKCPARLCEGFGCYIHHLAYCFIAGLALNLTVILDSNKAWLPIMQHLQPINFTFSQGINCTNNEQLKTINWDRLSRSNSSIDQYDVLQLSPLEDVQTHLPFRPLAVPVQLQPKLERLTESPFLLFVGHIVDYLLRPNVGLKERMDAYYSSFDLSTMDTLVGLHVRRKGLKNDIYPLADYMDRVWEYFDIRDTKQQLDLNTKNRTLKRKIYLATDDPKVWHEEVGTYVKKGYEFYGNQSFHDKIEEVLLDVWMLSQVDYLVCTFSSHICRLAYELMQVRQPRGRDTSLMVYSLNDGYYFDGQVRSTFLQ